MYKWFFAWRYLNTKLIAFFGIASVMLCVAMVLVVMSVMGGFLDTIRERSRGLLSEIVLDCGTAQGFPYYEEFQDYLNKELIKEGAVLLLLCHPGRQRERLNWFWMG